MDDGEKNELPSRVGVSRRGRPFRGLATRRSFEASLLAVLLASMVGGGAVCVGCLVQLGSVAFLPFSFDN